MNNLLHFSAEVAEAKRAGKPIVALESTIISHGMPYPENVETAKSVEALIREEGAIPATIALYQGKIQIGFDDALFSHFAKHPDVQKASRRDIAYYLTKGLSASTTVAATMRAAHLAHIPFFATGGIGGVHRGAEKSYDVSADLYALSDSPVVVISAGAKAILDLGKTLEVLETLSVPVIGYQTNTLPAFYSAESPFSLSHRCDTPDEIVDVFITQQTTLPQTGLLVTNPIPKVDSLPYDTISPVIEQAIIDNAHVQGKAITPALLAAITKATQGESLKANIKLIKNNALLAAKSAKAYAQKAC